MTNPIGLDLIAPSVVLKQVARALPDDFRENVIIIGSLAAAYHFFANDPKLQVRTKDVDCLLAPRIKAIPAGQAVADRLFAEHWELRTEGDWTTPGNATTPLNQLPVVRLHPPGMTEWFIELLTVPESEHDLGRKDVRLITSRGHFSLCSFGFLSVAEHQPISTPLGIAIARPEMMALANLLHHPQIGSQTMSGLIGGRKIKRSNKDLGRVLALAWLSEAHEADSVLAWPMSWADALRSRFPSQWRVLARRAGAGLRTLLEAEHELDLEEALHTCTFGLLASRPTSLPVLRATGLRLIQDAIEPLATLANSMQPMIIHWPDGGIYDPNTKSTSYRVTIDGERVSVRVSEEAMDDKDEASIRAKAEEKLRVAALGGTLPNEVLVKSTDFIPPLPSR